MSEDILKSSIFFELNASLIQVQESTQSEQNLYSTKTSQKGPTESLRYVDDCQDYVATWNGAALQAPDMAQAAKANFQKVGATHSPYGRFCHVDYGGQPDYGKL